MTDRLADLFAPFLADAARTVGVSFTVRTRPDREGHVMVLVTGPGGAVDGFTFDADASEDDHQDRVVECLDVLQESIHDHLARARGVFGPWPACPHGGHTHKLTAQVRSGTHEAWWTCRDTGPVVRVGGLEGVPRSS